MNGRRIARTTLALLALSLAPRAEARVLGLEVFSRTEVADGRAFGDAGPYERLVGRLRFSVALANPRNAGIVDLALAENLAGGDVAFSADVDVLQPRDPARGNGTMLLEIPNRGRGRIVSLMDGGTQDVKDPGDAWLLRRGYTIVTLGWQWDAVGGDALKLYAPIAVERGAPVTGLVRSDWTPSRLVQDVPLGHWFPLLASGLGGSEYPVADPSDPRNTLSVRDRFDGPRTVLPRGAWEFSHGLEGGRRRDLRWVHLQGGFLPGRTYELVYVARDPVIAGLGFAAVRDVAAWAKHDSSSAVPARRVIAEGISQDGRFLRDFLYQGFNADEDGRMALDGVLAHVAGAGRGSFNQRFAQPSRDGQPTASFQYPVDLFPFTDLPETDPVTGAKAGLLDRARADHVVPRLFLSHTSYEYWGRAVSLIHTSADGNADTPIGDDVRVYHFAGLQHFSGPWPPATGEGELASVNRQSPLPIRWFWRAMLDNMDAWVRSGTAPPPSRYPHVADGTLVPLSAYRFPGLPGVDVPAHPLQAWRLDFGPLFASGIRTNEPPKAGAAFPVRVPQCDADGNDLGGIRLPEVSVPLGTYTGWNLRDPATGASDRQVAFLGSFVPFAKDSASRTAVRDPRPSVMERYSSREDYLARYAAAVRDLVRRRFVLAEDADAMIRHGAEEWDWAVK